MKKTLLLAAVLFHLLRPEVRCADLEPGSLLAFEPEQTLTLPLPGPAKQVDHSFGRRPLSFERNEGRADAEAKFLVRGRGYQLFLTETEAVMVLVEPRSRNADFPVGELGPLETRRDGTDQGRALNAAPASDGAERLGLRQSSAAFASPRAQSKAPEDWRSPKPGGDATAPKESPTPVRFLRTTLVGANPSASISGEEPLPGKFNYFIGNDPSLWRTNVSTFAKVRYREVYPGIDLVYYGNEGQLEYDFVVAPGADPNRIAMAIEGADKVAVDRTTGELVLDAGGRQLRWRKPVVYQEIEGARREIAGTYRLHGGSADDPPHNAQQICFELATYDRSLALVIDPALVYSIYLPLGNDIWYNVSAIAVSGEDSTFVTGVTAALDFPTKNPMQPSLGGKTDAFVTKLDAAGQIVYSTYIGGNEQDALDYGLAIKADSTGNAYVAGVTTSTNFPTANALQPHYAGGNGPSGYSEVVGDAFVLKLAPEGSALVYSTYLGGSGVDAAYAMALGNDGSAYVVGSTASQDFPVTNAFQATYRGGELDTFIAKLSPSGNALVYSTYLGGQGNDRARGVAVDASGQAFIVGRTFSVNLPVKDSFQSTIAHPAGISPGQLADIFITQLTADGKAVVFSTYFGGSGHDDVHAGVVLGSNGDLYFAGETVGGAGLGTWFDDFPTVAAFQPHRLAGACGYVTRFSPITKAPVFSSYFGRTVDTSGNLGQSDAVGGIAVGTDGQVYLAGYTRYGEFPLVDPLPGSELVGNDDYASYAAVMAADGSKLLFSTLLASGFSEPHIASGDQGSFHIAGVTSSDSPVLQNPIIPAPAGAHSVFLAKLTLEDAPLALLVTRSGDSLVIRWPAAVSGAQLEMTDTLNPGAAWFPVPTTPVIIGNEQTVTVNMSATAQFFRLHKP